MVRQALKGIKFNKPYCGEQLCNTGMCPLAVAVILSGGSFEPDSDEKYTPTQWDISSEMAELGLIAYDEREEVEVEAYEFINSYSTSNHTWKKYL